MGYNYLFNCSIKVTPKGIKPCHYTQNNYLGNTPEGNWLVYVDMGASYAAPKCSDLEAMLPKQSTLMPQPCEFIAYASHNSINTDILIRKSTTRVREWIRKWS